MIPYLDFNALLEHCLEVDPTANVYLLLDHGGMPGLARRLSRTSAEWVSLFENTNERNALSVAPILVHAARDKSVQLSPKLLDWLSEHGTYSSAVSIVASSLELKSLKTHLVGRLDVKLSENMEAMLRFFDPRVLGGLVEVLTVEQRSAFFSPVSTWWFIDREGIAQRAGSGENRAGVVSLQLQLTGAQETKLISTCEADQILASLRQDASNLIRQITYPQQYAFVARYIKHARYHGIESFDDLILYCVIALTMGEKFMSSQIWRDAMRTVEEGSTNFATVVASMNLDARLEALL